MSVLAMADCRKTPQASSGEQKRRADRVLGRPSAHARCGRAWRSGLRATCSSTSVVCGVEMVESGGLDGGIAWTMRRPEGHAGITYATGPGGGVLDKPGTAMPKFDLDQDNKTSKKKPPRYQVLLHNDEVNRREYVVKVLLKIVPTLTMDDAVNIMNEAHFNGMAAVIICAQEEAEEYCEGLRNNGLVSTIEPVGGGKTE